MRRITTFRSTTDRIYDGGHTVYHHHISVMELGHLLTRSGLTYPEVSSKVYHDSFCQLGSSVSLPWVIMPVQRLKVTILPLDLPCSGPVTHSVEILTTGKSHGKKPIILKYKTIVLQLPTVFSTATCCIGL